MTTGRPAGVTGDVTQEHADLAGGMRDPVQRAPPEEGDPTARVEPEQQTQRAGLTGPGRPEQHGDASGVRLEGEVVDGG